MSPALAGRFLTTVPPGKSPDCRNLKSGGLAGDYVSCFCPYVIFKMMYAHFYSVLYLLLRKKYTEKLFIKELQNVVSPGRFTLEKPQLQVQEVACQSQIKQFQVRTTKLYFMANWHPLKVCGICQGHSTENQHLPVSWRKFPLLSLPYARFL